MKKDLGKKVLRTILFDLDGTLIDTEPAAARAVENCFRDWRMQVAPEDARYITGRTWSSAVDYLFAKYRFPVAKHEATQTMVAVYREELERELPVVPGSAEAVKDLAHEYPLGLVSGSNRTEILWALDRLGIRDHFQIILGAEDYPRSKPEPDGYLHAMRFLSADPASVLIFEDSSAGILSAKAAGAWVVAVTCTNHFGQETDLAHQQIADLTGVDRSWIRRLSETLR